jgi:hypothetical protein
MINLTYVLAGGQEWSAWCHSAMRSVRRWMRGLGGQGAAGGAAVLPAQEFRGDVDTGNA